MSIRALQTWILYQNLRRHQRFSKRVRGGWTLRRLANRNYEPRQERMEASFSSRANLPKWYSRGKKFERLVDWAHLFRCNLLWRTTVAWRPQHRVHLHLADERHSFSEAEIETMPWHRSAKIGTGLTRFMMVIDSTERNLGYFTSSLTIESNTSSSSSPGKGDSPTNIS